jgi:hypothetical protein
MNAELPTNIADLALSSTENRALTLLGQGIAPTIVASAVGVSESRISQLISDPIFSARVAELRFESLSAHTARDHAYDSIEDVLIARLKDMIPYMYKPMEVVATIRTINQAKRRGAGSESQPAITASKVINLTLPIQIVNQFKLDGNNQVIQTGEQPLITMQSGNMNSLLDSKRSTTLDESQNVKLLQPPAAPTQSGCSSETSSVAG